MTQVSAAGLVLESLVLSILDNVILYCLTFVYIDSSFEPAQASALLSSMTGDEQQNIGLDINQNIIEEDD